VPGDGMPKSKIAISLDDRLLKLIDKQRGEVKRSTYINTIITQHFEPALDENRGGATFVTTLELRKTLKGIHDRLKVLDTVSYNVQELEAIVYEHVFETSRSGKKGGRKKEVKVKMVQQSPLPELLAKGQRDAAVSKRIDKWLDKTLEKEGGVMVERDLADYALIKGVEPTPMALVREMRTRGLSFREADAVWVRE